MQALIFNRINNSIFIGRPTERGWGEGGLGPMGYHYLENWRRGRGDKLPFALGPKILMADLLIGRINFGNPVK